MKCEDKLLGKKSLGIIVLSLSLPITMGASSGLDDPASRPGKQDRPREERIRVTYQLTDVVVKDRDGNIVHGLGPEDFILKIDKREVEIKSVDEFTGAKAEAPSVVEAEVVQVEGEENLEDVESDASETEEMSEPIPPRPRFILILFDRFNMGVKGMELAKESAKKVISEGLSPGDQVAVFQYNRSLRALTGPTSNKERILAAIDAAGGPSMNDNYVPSLSELQPPSSGVDAGRTRAILMQKVMDFKQYVNSIRILSESLRKVPGRKSFLVYSEGPNVFNPVQLQNIPLTRANETVMSSQGRSMTQRSTTQQGQTQQGQQPQQGTGSSSRSRTTTTTTSNNSSTFLAGSRGMSSMQSLIGILSPQIVARELEELSKHLNSINVSLFTIRRGGVQSEWLTPADVNLADTPRANLVDPTQSSIPNINAKTHDSYHFMSRMTGSTLKDMENVRLDVLRDSARMTNGKFFDAGMNDDKLIENLQEETGDYYLVGFVPPKKGDGSYHRIEVKARNPEYKIFYREGYFEPKSFSKMDGKERAVHLEEGFLVPGILNELDLQARGYLVPLGNNPTAVVTFRIDPELLESKDGGGRELEYVINLEDRQGRMRFRDHKIVRSIPGEQQPDNYWLSCEVPVLNEPCAAYLAVRDNVSGNRSTWRGVFLMREGEEDEVILPPPILLSTSTTGDLSKWNAHQVKDERKLEEPLQTIGLRFPGKPILDNTVAQGHSANLIITAGNLGEGFNPGSAEISVNCALFDDTNKTYVLAVSDQRVSYLASQGLLLVSASVPIGLAQRPIGELRIVIEGLPGKPQHIVTMPVRVDPFDPEEAAGMLYDSRIEAVQ